jgi:4-hydroxy 2-oxovalerate aldolase
LNKQILVYDVTLRDGSHAIQHQLTKDMIISFAKLAESAGIPMIEVGHGNGLGASSLLIGQSLVTDHEMLAAVRTHLVNTKLGIHVMPGIATIKRDIKKAFEIGVDVIRCASHCTEADTTERHISYAREKSKQVFGILMMSHMAPKEVLVEEASKMESYGAEALIIMDSAGAYLPHDVHDRIRLLVEELNIPVGFHAHNNLGMAIANSVAAVEAGASIVDCSARGFGAGAGNAQIEVLVAVLEKMGYKTGIDFYKLLDASDLAEKIFGQPPTIKSISIVSGLAGVFSGFAKHVERIAIEYSVDPRDIFLKLGERMVIAGQEDVIIEVASELQKARTKK